MSSPARVIEVARSQLGTKEVPVNRTKYGAWYGMDGAAWCAMFVSWVFDQAGLRLPATTSKGFAYTPSGAAWFQKQGRWHTGGPRPGDVVFFRFSGPRIHHVGIVEAVNSDGSITTIEGNTSSGTAGSQVDGGGVYRRVRRVGIVGYGRPAWSSLSPPAHQTTGGNDVGTLEGRQAVLLEAIFTNTNLLPGISAYLTVLQKDISSRLHRVNVASQAGDKATLDALMAEAAEDDKAMAELADKLEMLLKQQERAILAAMGDSPSP